MSYYDWRFTLGKESQHWHPWQHGKRLKCLNCKEADSDYYFCNCADALEASLEHIKNQAYCCAGCFTTLLLTGDLHGPATT